MKVSIDDMLDAMGMGLQHTVSRFLTYLEHAALAESPEDEKANLGLARNHLKRMAQYRGAVSFPFPMPVTDSILAKWLPGLAAERSCYYAMVSLLWRGSVAQIQEVLTTRMEKL